jgi:hypothetical protein
VFEYDCLIRDAMLSVITEEHDPPNTTMFFRNVGNLYTYSYKNTSSEITIPSTEDMYKAYSYVPYTLVSTRCTMCKELSRMTMMNHYRPASIMNVSVRNDSSTRPKLD